MFSLSGFTDGQGQKSVQRNIGSMKSTNKKNFLFRKMNKENGRKQKPTTSSNLNSTHNQDIKRRRKQVLENENLDLRTRELLRDTFESISKEETQRLKREIAVREDLKRLHVENTTMRMNYEKLSKKLENVTEELRGRINFLNEAVGVEMFLKISKSIREETNAVEEKLNRKIDTETKNKDEILNKTTRELQNALSRITNIENNTYTLVTDNKSDSNHGQTDQYDQYNQVQMLSNQYNNPLLSEPYQLP